MSTQLIIFPQSYNGQYNALSANANEFVVNGISFSGLDTSPSFDSLTGGVIADVTANAPASIVNTWYRFRSTILGTPTLPTVVSGDAVLVSTTTNTQSGIYQRLSGLTIGQQYTFTVNQTSTGTGNIILAAFDGATFIFNDSNAATNAVHTSWFTATATTNTILIYYSNTSVDSIQIGQVSVVPQGTTPSGTEQILDDGQVICDLYEDEDIPLTLSVDDFKNVAEAVQSYSKAFNLPATKRNNQIFDNVFEITRSAQGNLQFNPYAKTQCTLKQDGLVLFQGYLRLIDIQDKEGEISYNVNLYSEVVALMDVLDGKTFSDMDFSELNHSYDYSSIRQSWQGTLPVAALPLNSFANNTGVAGATITNVLNYPFVDWEHSYTVGSSSGFPVLPNLESSFRPFIKIRYLIEMIFNQPDVPFTYTSDFISSDIEFQKLYMDFNWGDTPVPLTYDDSGGLASGVNLAIGGSYTTVVFKELSSINNGPTPYTTLSSNFGYDEATGKFTATTDNQTYIISYGVFLGATTGASWSARWAYTPAATGVSLFFQQDPGGPVSDTSSGYYSGSFTRVLQAGDILQMQVIETSGANLYVLTNTTYTNSTGGWYYFNHITCQTTHAETTTNTLLQTLRGELGQWEFLKGIMTMFNLISIPDKSNPNNILIEPYGDVFINNTNSGTTGDMTLAARSIAHDWTDKIDVTQIKLKPLTDLNKNTIFKFVEDDDDYAFNVYKASVGGHLYGSKKFDATTTTGGFQSVLDGEEEIIAEPFAATVVKPLMSQFADFITPAVYSYNSDDGTSEAFDNSPRIMFNNYIHDLTSCTYFVPDQNNVLGDSAEDELMQFSHLTTIPNAPTSLDFHFGECQLVPPVGSPTAFNLFNLYWLPYFNELYDPDTRIMSLKVNLTPADIATFNMYDTVFIKNRQFRVNKIDYKPNDLATVEFILIP